MAMAFSLSPIASSTPRSDHMQKPDSVFLRSISNDDLSRRARIQRSYSDNNIRYSVHPVKASMPKNSGSVGFFNIQIPAAVIPDPIKALLLETGTSKVPKTDNYEESDFEDEIEIGEGKKQANWIERLMELRRNWAEKQARDEYVDRGDDSAGCEDEEQGCDVYYDEDADEMEINIDAEVFSSLLNHVSWSDNKLFSQLAFLSNIAYVIPDIKSGDLERLYGLDLVTSSLVKKAEAEALKDRMDHDSIRVPVTSTHTSDPQLPEEKPRLLYRPEAAYDIAASAATFVQSQDKDLLCKTQLRTDFENRAENRKEKDKSSGTRIYNSELAASVAASTMTAVVAAGEKEKEQAAKDLQSLHSSPCEWFVCDDESIYTRYFVIQGSDSVASWQANLFFEPTKFEDTNVLVHRGIYEAAKGIYDQFMPEIQQHLSKFGDRAKFQFTGHSLGGSLALLVNLMMLKRKELNQSTLLPVVTFGSPYVFCNGQRILDQLGLDEGHVHCVMMHRDIVPRAFSCNYPSYVAQLLKRLNGTFRAHPCLNKNKLLYTPMGKLFILQPDEKSSPPHPLLPSGSALYRLDNTNASLAKRAVKAFLNSPHPLKTLSDPTAYGPDGTILRDHDSSNYLKAINEVIRQHTRQPSNIRKAKRERNQLWPLLTSRSPHAWSNTCNIKDRIQITGA